MKSLILKFCRPSPELQRSVEQDWTEVETPLPPLEVATAPTDRPHPLLIETKEPVLNKS